MHRRYLLLFAALLSVVAVISSSEDSPVARGGPVGGSEESEAALAGSGRRFKTPEPPNESALKNGLMSTLHGVSGDVLLKARAQADSLPVSVNAAAAWKELGPKPFISDDVDYLATNGEGWSTVTGRVTSLALDPANANIVYAGFAGGGVWRSENGGDSWVPLGDTLPSTPVGAVAIDPANPHTVFVGTGEANIGGDNIYGTGVYRSKDDGKTWERVAQNVAADSSVAYIEIAGGRIFVATTKGLYRSTDGGDSYHDVLLPTNAAGTAPDPFFLSNIVSDVKAKPGTPDQITAAVGWRRGKKSGSTAGALYRSTSGGAPGTWTRMAPTGFGVPDPNPQSTDPVGRVTLAYQKGVGQDPNVMWAVIQDPGVESGDSLIGGQTLPPKYTSLNGIYRSSNDGASWTLKATSPSLATDPTSALAYRLPQQYGPGIQSWYNQYILVDPYDAERVILGLEEVYQSLPGANAPAGLAGFRVIGRYNNLCVITYPCDPTLPGPVLGGITTHPDQHAAAIGKLPDGTIRLYAGGDGGVWRQDAKPTIGYDNESWTSVNSTIGTTMPYDAVMGGDGTVYMGLQDNGTAKILPNGKGIMVQGGDGFDVVVDPKDSNYVFTELPYGDLYRSKDGGKNWVQIGPNPVNAQFDAPIDMDARDANHIAFAGRAVYESIDKGNSWLQTFDTGNNELGKFDNSISAIGVEGSAVYAGFCGVCDVITQGNGDVTRFHNGIATNVVDGCERVVGKPPCWKKVAASGLPNRYITDIAVDQQDPKTVYVTLAGYSRRGFAPLSSTPGVGSGHLFVSRDAGATFANASGNLPEVVINSVTLRDNKVIVGSDVGTFIATKGSTLSFGRLGTSMPNAPVWDTELNPDGSKLVAATHGRGVWVYDFNAVAELGGSARPSAGGGAGSGGTTPATGTDPRLALAGTALLTLALAVRRRLRPSRH